LASFGWKKEVAMFYGKEQLVKNLIVKKLNKKFTGRLVKKLNNQQGFLGILVAILALGFIALFIAGLVLLMLAPKSENSDTENLGGKAANIDTHNTPNPEDTHNLPNPQDSHKPYDLPQDNQDLSTGYLVCVNLPGIRSSRTPALDVRVARRYLAVKQDLDAQGVPTVSFSWAFRTTCQQVNVRPSGRNPKAQPGSSPHEAGRALDVVGLDRTSDAFRKKDWDIIVKTFKAHGWRWLGPTYDPPHMDIQAWQVGEKSNYHWILKSQADFKRGGPKEGCRGPECGS
jgi:hypothetical protein